jgi:valyl-tRNA synthetase
VAGWAFDQILVMLHPLMPFVTEELWHAMGERPYDLIVAKWPKPEAEIDRQARFDLDWAINLIQEIRSARTELNVPPGAELELRATKISDDVWPAFSFNHQGIRRLARLGRTWVPKRFGSQLTVGAAIVAAERELEMAPQSIAIEVSGLTAFIPLGEHIDLDAERSRLSKAVAAAEKDRDSLAARLANPAFTERAKPEAVEKARADHDARAAEAERLAAALKRLG